MNASTQLTIVQQATGVPITLNRGAVSVTIPRVVRGSTRGEITGEMGSLTEFTLVDWLISVWQSGVLGKPKRGDTIVCNDITYTVAHPDANTQAVVDHGNDGTAWRIHSVRNP